MTTIEKLEKLIYEGFKDTDRKFQETDKEIKEMTAQFKESKKMVDALTGKWGSFVEGLLIPAVQRLFQERGIVVNQVFHRAEARKNGKQMEIDILAVNAEYVVLVEAKSTLSVDDVNEHLERLANFKTFFPRYDDCKVIGAVAGIVIEQSADRYAYKKGLFVIAQSGEMVKILNDEQFQPVYW